MILENLQPTMLDEYGLWPSVILWAQNLSVLLLLGLVVAMIVAGFRRGLLWGLLQLPLSVVTIGLIFSTHASALWLEKNLLRTPILADTVPGWPTTLAVWTGILALVALMIWVGQGLGELLADLREIVLLPLGLARVWAIAKLSIKESIRRRVLYVFVLFLLPFLFAGWYLPNSEEGQLQFLVAFVTTAMTWLLLPMVLFVVSMSLPNDLKNKTLHTVVTKPVRRLEIVVGRILGFVIIFTGVLVVMGAISLLYLYNQITPAAFAKQWTARVPVYGRPIINVAPYDRGFYFIKDGKISTAATNIGKEWDYRSHIGGSSRDAAIWNMHFRPGQFNHTGTVTAMAGEPGKPLEVTAPNHGLVTGQHVRMENVQGETAANGSWIISVVDANRFQLRGSKATDQKYTGGGNWKAGPLVGFRFDIYKTTKGDPTREGKFGAGVWASLEFASLDALFQSEHKEGEELPKPQQLFFITSHVNNNRLTVLAIPPAVVEHQFVQITVRCITPAQFLGMSWSDLYILASERSFEFNFAKNMFSLWLRVVLLIVVAVAASTVFNGFVTVLFTVTMYILSTNYGFMQELAFGKAIGGGPLESLIRLVLQANQMVDLGETFFIKLALNVDKGLLAVMRALSYVVPDLSKLDTTGYVAEGYDISWLLLFRNLLIVLAYVIPVVVAGFYLLRRREIAS